MNKKNFTFKPEGGADADVAGHIKEMFEAFQHAKKAAWQFAAKEAYPDGSLMAGTMVKAVIEQGPDDTPTDFFGIIINDWYKPEGDGAMTRNGNRYEVLLFNHHRPIATRPCRPSELKPLFEEDEFESFVSQELKPTAMAVVASLLGSIKSEHNCPACGRSHRAKLGEQDEE